ncbi:hypothetical protein VIMY103929_12660 [Vibrio mytili]
MQMLLHYSVVTKLTANPKMPRVPNLLEQFVSNLTKRSPKAIKYTLKLPTFCHHKV